MTWELGRILANLQRHVALEDSRPAHRRRGHPGAPGRIRPRGGRLPGGTGYAEDTLALMEYPRASCDSAGRGIPRRLGGLSSGPSRATGSSPACCSGRGGFRRRPPSSLRARRGRPPSASSSPVRPGPAPRAPSTGCGGAPRPPHGRSGRARRRSERRSSDETGDSGDGFYI
jgi:hypothetical protein